MSYALGAVLGLIFCISASQAEFLFVGGYGEKVTSYSLNSSVGLTKIGEFDVGVNPTSLVWQDNSLYTVNEVYNFPEEDTGGIGVFTVDEDAHVEKGGKTISAQGEWPCHITIDTSSKSIFVSKYGNNHFGAFWYKKGDIGDLKYLQDYGAESQAHASELERNKKFVYVTDVGGDSIWHYRILSNGTIRAASPLRTNLPAGSEPKEIAFHQTTDHGYALLKNLNLIVGYNVNTETGKLVQFGNFSTIPANYNGTAHAQSIVIHPNGKYLYVSNRDINDVQQFSIGSDGNLKQLNNYKSYGYNAEFIAMSPTGQYLVVCNQRSSNIVIFEVDAESGNLTYKFRTDVTTPTTVAFQIVTQPDTTTTSAPTTEAPEPTTEEPEPTTEEPEPTTEEPEPTTEEPTEAPTTTTTKATTTTTEAPVTTYLPSTPVPPVCEKEGFLRNKENCNIYYVCTKDPHGGFHLRTMHCPQNLFFDLVTEHCVYQEQVPECLYSSTTSTTEEPTTTTTQEPTDAPTTEAPTTTTTEAPTTEEPTTVAPTTEEPTPVPTTEEPTPEPTTKEPTPEPTTKVPTPEPTTEPPTPAPTTEQPTTAAPNTTVSSTTPTTPTTGTTDPTPIPPTCDHQGYIRNEVDCRFYYYCQIWHGGWRLHTFECPHNLFFHLIYQACVYPAQVPECPQP